MNAGPACSVLWLPMGHLQEPLWGSGLCPHTGQGFPPSLSHAVTPKHEPPPPHPHPVPGPLYQRCWCGARLQPLVAPQPDSLALHCCPCIPPTSPAAGHPVPKTAGSCCELVGSMTPTQEPPPQRLTLKTWLAKELCFTVPLIGEARNKRQPCVNPSPCFLPTPAPTRTPLKWGWLPGWSSELSCGGGLPQDRQSQRDKLRAWRRCGELKDPPGGVGKVPESVLGPRHSPQQGFAAFHKLGFGTKGHSPFTCLRIVRVAPTTVLPVQPLTNTLKYSVFLISKMA